MSQVNPTSNFKLTSLIVGIDGEDTMVGINNLLQLQYIEDIKSASTQIFITITDTAEGSLSKINGMEPVYISFDDDQENTFTNTFIVYDVQGRMIKDGKSKGTLCCCSPDLVNNAATKVSRRFGTGGGKQIDKIVGEDILTDLLATNRGIIVEPTKNKFSFISSYWSPFTMIQYLASKAIPAEGKDSSNASAGYAFFENADGYIFQSYDKFANDAAKDKIAYRFVAGFETADVRPNTNLEYTDVSSLTVVENGDILMGLNIGSYNSKVMTFDMMDNGYAESDFNIHKYYNSVPKMNGDVTLPKYFEKFKKNSVPTRIMSKVVHSALYTEGTFTKDLTKVLAQSSLREKLFYNKKVEVEFIGSLNHKVGEIVELTTYKGKDRVFDAENSGKYVIGRVEREYVSSNSNMVTKLILYTDSAGSVSTTSHKDNTQNGLLK
tara:strand:+ start:6734 stop:8041 length:1308 start_codon:yes stop_codon:yes gene_type:complete